MSKKFIQATLKRTEGRLEFIATDETLDRQGEVIPMDSWDLGNYTKNPVLLVNHDYKVENIVGRAERVRISEEGGRKAMVFEPMFHELTQLSREVKAMVEEGILSTVSVGFLRKSPSGDGDKQLNELMEISFVPVPANPSAERIRSIMSNELSQEELMAVKSFIGKEEDEGDMSEMLGAMRGRIGDMKECVDDVVSMMDQMMEGKSVKIVKEGRVLSTKNRRLLQDAVTALQAVIDASEPDKNESNASGEGETVDTPKAGQGKAGGRAGKSNRDVRLLKRVAKEINHALYKAKQNL